jgi:hypothetical protein
VSGTRVAETILASVHMRARQQAGHMDASDLIKSMQRQPCKEGAVHIWGPDADRRAKLLIPSGGGVTLGCLFTISAFGGFLVAQQAARRRCSKGS